MTSFPIVFDLPAAQNALARADEGDDLKPGDTELIAAYDGFCQQEWDRFQDACDQADRAVWLAAQCVVCGPTGSTGPECDECFIDHDQAMRRTEDH